MSRRTERKVHVGTLHILPGESKVLSPWRLRDEMEAIPDADVVYLSTEVHVSSNSNTHTSAHSRRKRYLCSGCFSLTRGYEDVPS